MAKIAVELERALAQRTGNGAPGRLTRRVLAKGDGWAVEDIICTSGPQDRSFEERYSNVSIAVVMAGSFQCRSQSRSGIRHELLTPGSLLLGNAGQCFECGHEHGAGDRCLSFQYAPDYFENLYADIGASGSQPDFRALRLPPMRELALLVARACAGLLTPMELSWEELSIHLAAQAVQLAHGLADGSNNDPPSAVARITRAARMIERHPNTELTLSSLAQEAGLSPYHFLRIFERLTGLTPHQYILRTRLREAAARLTSEPSKILDIALDCGFGDVSNFNRAFRTEFGVSPRVYRKLRAPVKR